MTKKFTHSDAVQHHVFFCMVMWIFGCGLLVTGLMTVGDGVSNQVFAWGKLIAGSIGLVCMPIRLWLAWPKRDDK